MPLVSTLFAAAQDLNVHIVDGRNGGIGWRDLVIPTGALIAGVGGVLVGGVIQRRLEAARGAREERLDALRADRERELEDARRQRSDNAEKRRTIGTLRLARRYLFRIRNQSALALRIRAKAPMQRGLGSPLRPDDEHLMASWVTSQAWDGFSRATSLLQDLQGVGELDDGAGMSTQLLTRLEELYDQASTAIGMLRVEENRLARDVDDPAADRTWSSLRQHSWPQVLPSAEQDDDDRYPTRGTRPESQD